MSGFSGDMPCPNCGLNMDIYSDTRPHDFVSGQCLECGFYYVTNEGFMTLEEVNMAREDYGELEPLKKLKPVHKDFKFLIKKKE